MKGRVTLSLVTRLASQDQPTMMCVSVAHEALHPRSDSETMQGCLENLVVPSFARKWQSAVHKLSLQLMYSSSPSCFPYCVHSFAHNQHFSHTWIYSFLFFFFLFFVHLIGFIYIVVFLEILFTLYFRD